MLAQPSIAAAADTANLPRFDIFEYMIGGNSLLAVPAIEQAVSPFLGEGKTVRDVEGARAALERAYHGAGYLTVLVSIPEQNVDAGTVALNVVEASIEKLTVKGAEYTLPSELRSRVPELAEGNVPNFNKLQEQLAAVNRGQDVKATPILRAGRLPGTVEAQLDIEDQLPLHGSVEFSNRATPNTTTQRLSASLRYDNLWQLGHSAGLTLQTAPQRTSDASVIAGTYVMPVHASGSSLTLYAVHSRSQFAILSTDLGVLSNSDTMGLRLTVPLTADAAHNVAIGADRKAVKSNTLLQGIALPSAPITYVPLVATYNGNWRSDARTTTADLKTTLGLRGMLGNSEEQFVAKGASANYQVLRAGMAHTENLASWSLHARLELQAASTTLVPTERFIAGGAETVRGYMEGERASDGGVRASLELRTPQVTLGQGVLPARLSGLAFFDSARLRNKFRADTQQLRSVGIGLRVVASQGVAFELDAARALVDGDVAYTRAGDTRLHSRLIVGF